MMKFTETMQCRQYNLLCIMWAPVSCVTCQCTIGCPGQLLGARSGGLGPGRCELSHGRTCLARTLGAGVGA